VDVSPSLISAVTDTVIDDVKAWQSRPLDSVYPNRLCGRSKGLSRGDRPRSNSVSFEKKWQGRFPSIAKSWRSNWVHIIPFFSYPPAIRRVIYTTNAIESIQAQLRKVNSNRGAFPSPEAVRKILYLAIERISKRWKRPIRDWVAALNHFSVVFEGRIPV